MKNICWHEPCTVLGAFETGPNNYFLIICHLFNVTHNTIYYNEHKQKSAVIRNKLWFFFTVIQNWQKKVDKYHTAMFNCSSLSESFCVHFAGTFVVGDILTHNNTVVMRVNGGTWGTRGGGGWLGATRVRFRIWTYTMCSESVAAARAVWGWGWGALSDDGVVIRNSVSIFHIFIWWVIQNSHLFIHYLFSRCVLAWWVSWGSSVLEVT